MANMAETSTAPQYKKTTVYYVKTAVVTVLLGVESFFATKLLIDYVKSQKYFAPPMSFLASFTGLMLLLLFTYFLTVGAWIKWEQYVIVPLPISLGIFIAIYPLNTTYAMLISISAYLLLCYDVMISTNLKKMLIQFKPRHILRFSTKGILFMFALIAGVIVLVVNANPVSEIDIGGKLGELTQTQYEKFVEPKINDSAQRVLINELEGKGLPTDPEMFSMLSGLTDTSSSFMGGLPGINLDLTKTVETEFNALIEPYKQFIPPLIALLVFALIRFLGGIAHFVFNILIDPIFALFKATGFLHTGQISVSKEVIGFDESMV